MKIAMKVLLILSPCLILAGISICLIGVAAGGSTHFGFNMKEGFVDYMKDEDGQEIQADRMTLAPFDTVYVNVDCMDVMIVEGEEYAVEYRANGIYSAGRVRCESKNGALEFSQSSSFSAFPFHFEVNLDFLSWFKGNWSSDDSGYYVKIYVPEGTSIRDLKVDCDLGEIALSKLQVDGNVEINADCGSIEMEDVTISRKCNIESDLGSVALTNCTLTDAEIELDCGDFDGKEITVLSNCMVDNALGSITLSMKGGLLSELYRYDCDTDLGSVDIAGEDCGSKASGGSGTAGIILRNDCGSIEVE